MDRTTFLFIFNFLYHIVCISPFKNTMGNNEGDNTNKEGNMVSSFKMEFVSHLIMFVISVSSYYCDNNPASYFDTLLLFLAISGAIIRYKAYYDLKQYFTFDIGIKKEHKLITTGIYKFIAHPGYLGSLLSTLSFFTFALKSISYISLLTFTSIVIYLFYDRIKKEETMLLNHFSVDYKNYLMSTKRLIPFVY